MGNRHRQQTDRAVSNPLVALLRMGEVKLLVGIGLLAISQTLDWSEQSAQQRTLGVTGLVAAGVATVMLAWSIGRVVRGGRTSLAAQIRGWLFAIAAVAGFAIFAFVFVTHLVHAAHLDAWLALAGAVALLMVPLVEGF